MSSFKFPDSERLQAGLATALRHNGSAKADLTVLKRKANPYNSTFPTEIVTCRNQHNDGILHLFVKYGKGTFDSVYGHRGDLSYEAKVYREVLQPLHTSAPNFYGVYRDKLADIDWLIIEYLPAGHRASWSRDPRAMTLSAKWIGKFHAANEKRLSNSRLKFLHSYDRDYYTGWARRTMRFIAHSQRLETRFPWILSLCEEFQDMLPSLLESPRTIIHGECFGSNIVYQDSISRPIDWQSAAIAPGEIDLASLTLAWPGRFVKKMERRYQESRWPMGAPDSFAETLEAARFYMCLRWLGDPTLMSTWFRSSKRFVIPKDPRRIIAELYRVGTRLELV